MKKILVVLGLLAALYVASAIVVWCFVPDMIADAQSRLFGVRVAIAQLTNDQWVMNERQKSITNATLGKGKGKVDEVLMLLADPDLNHLALVYTGNDWSTQYSAFLGQVSHARKLLSSQIEARKKLSSRLNERVKELERRREQLTHKLKSSAASEEKWVLQWDNVERQLAELRRSNEYREYLLKDDDDKRDIEALAKNENAIYQIACDYQQSSIGTLATVLATKLGDLRWAANEPVRLYRIMSFYNIWPLNVLLKLPQGEGYEE